MTSFDEVYKSNGSLRRSRDLANKPDNIYYFLLSEYLKSAISVFSEFCYEDILDITKFEQVIETYSNSTPETTFVLSETPHVDAIFYIKADDVVLDESEYSYDSFSQTVTIPSGGFEVYIGAYIIGYFNNDISFNAIMIMADAMNEWYVESYVNDDTQLEQLMFSGVENHSQANHNKVNLQVEDFRSSKTFKRMMMYSYGKAVPSTVKLAKKAGGTLE